MALETEGLGLDPATVEAGIRHVMQEPALGFYLVAQALEETVGCLMVTMEWSDWRNSRFWWIQSVYVRPEFRRRGVFRELYRAVNQRAKARGGVCGIRLYVEHRNQEAQSTYRSLGMLETGYLVYEAPVSGVTRPAEVGEDRADA